jgi:hypothetical protein
MYSNLSSFLVFYFFQPRHFRARQKSSDIRRMSVSSDTNSALLDAVKVEGMKVEMDAVAAIHTAPGCDDFGHPLTSRDNSASLSPAAGDPLPAKRPKLEPDDSLNEVSSTFFVIRLRGLNCIILLYSVRHFHI